MTRKEQLLTILGEECSEVQQRCSKAIRFGLDEVQIGQTLSNKERILYELNDLFAVLEMVYKQPLVDLINEKQIQLKKEKVETYLLYSANLGTLTE